MVVCILSFFVKALVGLCKLLAAVFFFEVSGLGFSLASMGIQINAFT